MEQKHLRFAHSDGQTDVCFDDSGRYIVTSGSDGEVKIWDGFDDDSPVSHHVSDCAFAVAVKKDKFYVAVENKSVHCYSYPKGVSDSVIARFTDVVNTLHINADGSYLAMGSGDFQIKLVKLGTDEVKILLGHEAPILSVAIDPKGQFVASSSCDGSVKVWIIETGECVKSWNFLPKSNDFSASKTLARISWHPTKGAFFSVPVKKEIHIYERDTWKLIDVLKDDHFTEIISITSFSLCGVFLAASSYDGKIVIWNFSSRIVINRNKHLEDLGICGLAWRSKPQNDLLYSDNQGQIGMIENIKADQSENSEDLLDDLNAIFEDGDSFGESMSPVVDTKSAKKKVPKIEDNDDDNSNAIDIGAIKATFEPKIFGSQEEKTGKNSESEKVKTKEVVVHEKVALNVQQAPFQPGSTPVFYQHRYMLWNSVGIVCCYNTEEENTIDVEFHDTSVHHAIHVSNTLGHTIASLSEDGLVLACPIESERPSKLVCMHFGTWDTNREWMVDMPIGEQIQAVSIGKDFVVCVTNLYYLRLFSIGGLQLGVLSIPGPVVCMTCHETSLVLAYHHSAGLEASQDLRTFNFTFNSGKLILKSRQFLSLSPKATLAWLGFTDEGTPCSVDSKGVIRLFLNSLWTPILDTKEHTKGKSDTFFIVGLSEITQQVRYILCKGSHYPPTLPKPSVSVQTFKIPFCELSTDKAQLEEEYCRYRHLTSLLENLLKEDFEVDSELEISKRRIVDNLMKLFAFSVRSEREYRAVEVANLMPSSRVVQGAIHYSTQRHCYALAEKLGKIAYEKQEEWAEAVEDTLEEPSEDLQPVLNSKLSKANDDIVSVRPKPLNTRFSNPITNELQSSAIDSFESRSNDSVEATNENEDEPVDNVSKVEEKKNPFQVSSQKKKSLGGIDSLLQRSMESKKALKESTERITEPKIKPKKTTLNVSKKRKSETIAEQSADGPKKKNSSKDLSSKTATKISSFLFKKD